MKQNKGVFTYIIFFGALWGILEATLGYLLQFLPPLVSGSVMFPIAATLMILTYNHTKSKSAMIYVAMIAATIKSVNFFMPGLLPIKTYNPMISIMLQSLVMVLIIPLFQKKNVFSILAGLVVIGFSWRLLFLGNIAINHALTGFQFVQLQSLSNMIQFVFLYGIIESLVLALSLSIMLLTKQRFNFIFKPSMILSISSFAIAILLNVIL
ncbi:MAG: hypothetical protein CVV57_07935 [Tenericutes bacterium HGW-Tenericutes-2]|jgi:hypothetical protein|nr:MAG: hypothetical protein CVV57_07935 [Tenericutes bacterium HGW-Tenericutes-2]